MYQFYSNKRENTRGQKSTNLPKLAKCLESEQGRGEMADCSQRWAGPDGHRCIPEGKRGESDRETQTDTRDQVSVGLQTKRGKVHSVLKQKICKGDANIKNKQECKWTLKPSWGGRMFSVLFVCLSLLQTEISIKVCLVKLNGGWYNNNISAESVNLYSGWLLRITTEQGSRSESELKYKSVSKPWIQTFHAQMCMKLFVLQTNLSQSCFCIYKATASIY